MPDVNFRYRVFDKEMVTFIGRDLMDLEENKKVLLVVGMKQELDEGVCEKNRSFSSRRDHHFKKQ